MNKKGSAGVCRHFFEDMKRKNQHNRITAFGLAVLLVLTAFLGVPVYASEKDAVAGEISGLSGTINKLQSQMDEINELVMQLSNELQDIEDRIEGTNQEIKKTKRQLTKAKKDYQKQYKDMKLRIKYSYENNSRSIFLYMLENKGLTELFLQAEVIELMNEYDREKLKSFAETQQLIEDQTELLAKDQKELKDLEKELTTKQQEAVEQMEALDVDIKEYSVQLAEAYAKQAGIEAKEQAEAQKQAEVKEAEESGETDAGEGQTTENDPYDADASELDMMAAIIYCEAGNQSETGKVAVGAVVMNRVRSSRFSQNTIEDVIRAPGQFSPVSMGWFDRVLSSGAYGSCVSAAERALAGEDPTNGCLFFRTNNGHEGLVIGDIVFY